jgi:hypothetical protein
MVRADAAEVVWDAQKKSWVVRIRRGEEVIRRPCRKSGPDLADEALRALAVSTARDDGYELAAAAVTIKR